MFRTIAEFTSAWQGESASTLKVMQALTDGSLGQQVSPEGRSLGRLAWHIVQTLGEMGGHAGLTIDGANERCVAEEDHEVLHHVEEEHGGVANGRDTGRLGEA